MRILLLLMCMCLTGCAAQRTRVAWYDGRVIEITGTGDQLVEVTLSSKTAGGTVKIDSRKSSMLKDMIQWMLLRDTERIPR